MTKIYKSKVSYGLLLVIFLVFYGPLVPDLINKELNSKMLMTIGLLTLLFAFILHMFFKTRYIIDDNKLKIKSGFIPYKPIDIATIKEVARTKSIISSPAPSFDRIVIKYGKFDEIIISPKDKQNFVKDLLKINPEISNKIS